MKSHVPLSNNTYKAFKESLEENDIITPHLFFYVVKRLLTNDDFVPIKKEFEHKIILSNVGDLLEKLSKFKPECEVAGDYDGYLIWVTDIRYETNSEIYNRCYQKVIRFLDVAKSKRQNQISIGNFERISTIKEIVDYMIEHNLD